MTQKPWLKLWREMLEDPKIGRLSDRLFRRWIQILIMADDDGSLPDPADMSWIIRVDQDELETDLADLATTGLVHNKGNGWIVTNYVKRQSPMSNAERQALYRKRKHKSNYYSNEDVTFRYVEEEEEEEEEEEGEVEEEGEEELPLDISHHTIDVCVQVQQATGILCTPDDLIAYDEIRDLPVTIQDIHQALAEYTSKNGRLKYNQSLIGWIKTQVAKRTQDKVRVKNAGSLAAAEEALNGN